MGDEKPRLPPIAGWRNALRDSDVDAEAKLAGLVLSTYANKSMTAWPSALTIAAGASRSERTIRKALKELEASGFISVQHSKGRNVNRYYLTTPTVHEKHGSPLPTMHDMPGSDGSTVNGTTPNHEPHDANHAPAAAESVVKRNESAKQTREATPEELAKTIQSLRELNSPLAQKAIAVLERQAEAVKP